LQAVSSRYLARRLAQLLPTIAALILLTFCLIHLAPGDPVIALGGEHGDAGYYALIRARFGLDRPLPVQLLAYARNVLGGDLGVSYVHGRPVASLIAERLPATLLLMSTALLLSSAAGVALGLLAARRAHRPADLLLRSAALLGCATPSFWLAQVAVLALAIGTGLFPVQGMTDARQAATGLRHAADVLHHLALPALVLAANELALTTRLVRTGLLEALGTDYVRTARAKGLPEGRVARHALRNVLLPVVTVIGGRVGVLCSGAVLVEAVFAWPGLGQLLLSSLLARDYPALLGMFLLASLAVVLANLATDLVYGWLDPRIRYE
jgi:peptide/nickel transport system permease protein